MKQLIVCSAFDLHRLVGMVKNVKLDSTLLVSQGEFDKSILRKLATDKVALNLMYECDDSNSRLQMLQELKDVERAYFVVSSIVMGSSAYQAMTYSLYPRLLQVDCWKIMLDNANIPGGFAFLRNLPQGTPV